MKQPNEIDLLHPALGQSVERIVIKDGATKVLVFLNNMVLQFEADDLKLVVAELPNSKLN